MWLNILFVRWIKLIIEETNIALQQKHHLLASMAYSDSTARRKRKADDMYPSLSGFSNSEGNGSQVSQKNVSSSNASFPSSYFNNLSTGQNSAINSYGNILGNSSSVNESFPRLSLSSAPSTEQINVSFSVGSVLSAASSRGESFLLTLMNDGPKTSGNRTSLPLGKTRKVDDHASTVHVVPHSESSFSNSEVRWMN